MPDVASTKRYASHNSTVKFKVREEFDKNRMRHYVNGEVSVMHCHHYATLFTQLALDASLLNGTDHLIRTSFEAFHAPLIRYYEVENVKNIADRLAIAEQYFSFVGLGAIRFACNDRSAVVVMEYSHVDEGWLSRWGRRDSRVNYIGEGYIKAACAAAFDLTNPDDIKVVEAESIVCGAPRSRFDVQW
ncbi:MAG TPA: hypothetical protein PLF13_03670 [candidate division Zixibacteria bacterium]|nr:hypothetical protein [candidate division Zixibacteria bacterium]